MVVFLYIFSNEHGRFQLKTMQRCGFNFLDLIMADSALRFGLMLGPGLDSDNNHNRKVEDGV